MNHINLPTDTPRTDALFSVTCNAGRFQGLCRQLERELAAERKRVKQLEAELESSCSAEHLRQEREARKRVEAELAEEIKENCDQARLLAMSASRESATIGKTQRLETQNAKLRGLLERAITALESLNSGAAFQKPHILQKELEAITGELAPTGTVAKYATVQRRKNSETLSYTHGAA